MTDPDVAGVLGRDFHKVPEGVNGTAVDNALARVSHGRELAKEIPFPINVWWSIHAISCPVSRTRGNDRGVAVAHYQIWLDFHYQGSHKRGRDVLTASDRDVIVVFEDDAVIAVQDIKASLEKEISNMSSDLLFLGWCHGRKGIPMCAHAYVLTWIGIKNILKEWDHCSNSLDGQWKTLSDEKV